VTLPFGTALNAESTGVTSKRFTSYDRSATTGLDYAYNRHYDPQQGRFTQVDPAGMGATDLSSPQTLNLYAYCANDPINHVDPSGLGFFSFLKKVFGIIAKIVLVAIVVAAVVLTGLGILAIAGALAPYAGAGAGWAMLGLGAAGFGLAFGPRWLQIAISVALTAIGIYLQGPQAIWNFTEGNGHRGTLSGAAASVGAVAGYLLATRKRRPRSAKKKVVKTTVIVETIKVINQSDEKPKAYDPLKDPDDRYTVDTCREYGKQGRGDLETACGWFGDSWLARCIRRCLLDEFGPSPGGVYGEPGEYRGPNVPWPFGRLGIVAHAKCAAKCGGKGLIKVGM
jgi:RHS repeat-associated protein